jgi:hypothetical protein
MPSSPSATSVYVEKLIEMPSSEPFQVQTVRPAASKRRTSAIVAASSPPSGRTRILMTI